MKCLAWLLPPIALVIPGVASANGDGDFCLGPDYIAYQFGIAGPSDRLQWLYIVGYGAGSISEPDSIQLPQFQGTVHGMRCRAAAVDVAVWHAIHTVTLDSLRRPLGTRAVPLPRPGGFPPWTRGTYRNLQILPSLARGTLAPDRESLHMGPNGDEYVLEIAAVADSIRQCPPTIRARIVQFSRDGREVHARVLFREPRYLPCTRRNGVEGQLIPFLDWQQRRWGYEGPDGLVAITPRYLGAGEFRDGRAPVEDADGFAIIDLTGVVTDRISSDSVSVAAEPVRPPSDSCAWSGSDRVESTGLECYLRELRGSGPVVGGAITRTPPGGPYKSSSAIALRLPSGVVLIEQIGYEGFTRRVLLPGVHPAHALQWRRALYPDTPKTNEGGCSESWTTGAISGGAFIEQAAGC